MCLQKKYTVMCKYAHLRVFWFGHFPRSGIESESSFLIKCYIITVLNTAAHFLVPLHLL